MAISRSVGNFLGGVSQQPESIRLDNMAEESINAYPDIVHGLDKRNPTQHLADIVQDSTTNGYFHVIKRSPDEQYGIWFYRDTSSAVFAKAFLLKDYYNSVAESTIAAGTEVPIVADDLAAVATSDFTTYFVTTGQKVQFRDDDFEALTVADTTFLLNRNRVTALSTTPQDKHEDDIATIQITQGISKASYRITIDGVEYFYTTRAAGEASGTLSGLNADETRTRYIANRLMYGGYNEHLGPTNAAVEAGWDDTGSDPITTVMQGASGQDQQKKALGIIQSGKGTHFIHTESSSRTGMDSDYTTIASDSDPSINHRKWRLYGDITKWQDGLDGSTPNKTKFKLGVEYYDSTSKDWKVAETDFINFGKDITDGYTTIAADIETKLRALDDSGEHSIVVGSSMAGLSCAVVSNKWWGMEITADFDQSSDTEIRNIYVTDSEYEPPAGEACYAARRTHSSITVMKFVGGLTTAGEPDEEQYAGRAMTIKVEDDGGGQFMALAHKSALTFEEIPSVALDGQMIKIMGSPANDEDDYYLKFVADIDASEDYRNEGSCWGQWFGKGVWEESTPNKNRLSFDATTMPQVMLSKISSGSSADPHVSVVANGAPYFHLKTQDWDANAVGDSLTNKTPSFVGNTLSGITYYRGRLGLMSGINFIMSEAAGPYNFWKTSVASKRATDRFDITGRSEKVSVFNHAVEVNKNLILFSEHTQFLLSSGGDTLSSSTVGLQLLSSYESLVGAKPRSAGFSVYFPYFKNAYSGIHRLYPAGGAADLFKAEDIAEQVPKYIKGKVTDITVSDQEKIMLVLTEDADTLYVYKWADMGNKRVQSAWFKWTVGPTTITQGSDTYGSIRGCHIIDSKIYLLVTRAQNNTTKTNHVYLEEIDIEKGVVDIASTVATDDVWYVSRLDRRLASEDVSLSGGGTTVTFPGQYYLPGGTKVELVYRHGVSGQVGGFREVATVAGASTAYSNQVIFSSNHTGKKFYIGLPYTMRHTLSAPSIKTQQGTLVTGRIQVRRAWVDVANSGYFKTEVTPTGRSLNTDHHPSADVGLGATSEITANEKAYTIPISSRSNEYVCDLVNDSPYPTRFVTLEYEATYNSRSRRFG